MNCCLRIIVLAVLVMVLISPLAAQNTAPVFVFCGWESFQRGWLPISYDRIVIAKVRAGRFFTINASLGQHILVPGDGIPLVLKLRSTEPIFIRVARHITLRPSDRSELPALEFRTLEQARLELVNLSYVETDKIYSLLVAKKDPTLNWKPELKKRNRVD